MKTLGRRHRKTSFIEQAAILTVASLFARFLGFVYRLPLTDMIGDKGIGIYSIAYNIYVFFFVLSAAGLPAAISKMVSERVALGRHKDAYKVFKTALTAATVLGVVCFFILFFGADWLANLMHSPESYYSIMTLSPTVLIVAIIAVFRGYFQGLGNSVPSAVSQVVDQAFNAFFSVFCAWILINNAGGGDPISMGAAGGTLGTGIGALAGLIFILYVFYLSYPMLKKWRNSDLIGETETKPVITKELFFIAIPIILGTAVFSITNLIDSAMIKERLVSGAKFTEETATVLFGQLSGKYATITTLPISISAAVASAAIPSIAGSNIISNHTAVRKKINTALRITMLLSIPSAIGISVLAPQILQLLFPSHPEGGNLLRIGGISIIFLSLTQITTGMLQALGRVKVPVIAAACGALVKIPINYVLLGMPSVNILGAVISTIIFYAVSSVIDWSQLCKTANMKPDITGIIIKPLAASIIMGMVVYVCYYVSFYMFGKNWLSFIFSIVLGISAYIFALVFIKGIHPDDLRQTPFFRRFAKK